MTIREAITEGNTTLAVAGIDNPGLDISLLLAEALGVSRSSLIAAAADSLAQESLVVFHGLVKRRLAGECVAYILGRKEFYGLEFMVTPWVLVPRPDTETLVEAALERLTMNSEQRGCGKVPLRVLDLCTGSGALAIALKHTMPELEVWAADISAEALETAKLNAERLLTPDSIRFCRGNLFEALPAVCLPFHIIVSNPPYIPSGIIDTLSPEVQREPRLALNGGSGGLDIIRSIIRDAPKYMDSGGLLLLEADPGQMENIAAFLHNAGFCDVQTFNDLSGQNRVIQGWLK